MGKMLDRSGYQGGPPRLMTRSESLARFAVEIFVEEDDLAPERIMSESRIITIGEALGPNPSFSKFVSLSVKSHVITLSGSRLGRSTARAQSRTGLAIRQSEQPILTPSVGSAACMLVRKIRSGQAVGGAILPDRAPLPLSKIRTPSLPVSCAGGILNRPLRFEIGHSRSCRQKDGTSLRTNSPTRPSRRSCRTGSAGP